MLPEVGACGVCAALAGSVWVPRPMLFEIGLGPWPVWRCAGDDVALTFDDGPDPRYTPLLLDTLAECRIPATFFVSTSLARQHPDLVRRARREGHDVGSHGMSHTPLAFRRPGLLECEVGDAVRGLEDVLGEPVSWFRPPYGVRSPGLYRKLRREGLRPVFWSVMAYDWNEPTSRVVTRRVMRRVRPGAIVLLHDGGGNRGATVEAVPPVVEALQQRGLRCARLGAPAGARTSARDQA
jgi:peptidoglycan/xylan/chitin deacetylase (PgdA/CDA1 family)